MELRVLVWLGASPAEVFWLPLALTYFAHSLLWAVAATLLVRRATLSSAIRHLHWKMALIGPLVTALTASVAWPCLEHALGAASWIREVSMPSVLANSASTTPALLHDGARAALPEAHSWGAWIVACGLAAAALGLLRFLAAVLLLRERIRGRQEVLDARLLCRLAAMRARTSLPALRLTESPQLASPLVVGAAEICVPRGLLECLTEPEVDAVLAHELAHLERGDGIWFPLVGLIQCVFWLQPLNHWVAASFRQSAELACDDRAVELTRNPLGLARALVHVASSASRARPIALMPTMVRSEGALLPRVRRLTSAGAFAEQLVASGRGRLWAIATVTAVGGTLAVFSVRVAQAHLPERPSQAAIAVSLSSERMAELARREQKLTSLLAAAQSEPEAQQGSTPSSVRVLELSQELRHVRATQAWLERTSEIADVHN